VYRPTRCIHVPLGTRKPVSDLEFGITDRLSECSLNRSWRRRLAEVRGDLGDGAALKPQPDRRPDQRGRKQDDCDAFGDEDGLKDRLGGVFERR
jgi:hypothetical protein